MMGIAKRVEAEHGGKITERKMAERLMPQGGLLDVMEKALELFELWEKHSDEVNVTNLSEALALAVADGFDMCTVKSWMLMKATEGAKEIRESMA